MPSLPPPLRLGQSIEATLSGIFAKARIQGEVSVALTRLFILVVGCVYECIFLALHPAIAASPVGWMALVVLVFGAIATYSALRRLRAGQATPGSLSTSVGLDALLVFGASIGVALSPPEAYRGMFFHPTMPFFLVGIASSALRLSHPLVRLSVACNAACAVLLLAIDRVVGTTPMPGIEPYVLWIIAFAGAGFVADRAALLTRRLATEAGVAVVAAERARQTLGMYVSEEVAAVALGEGGALPGGHRQAAAVMFCDLRGFSTYAARFPPERVVAELNDYLVAMVTEIQREGGVVDKYIGDSIMAVFGVPRALPDAASRALRASVGMQRALAAHNVQRAAAGLPALHHDIGLHFGEVVVGNIGTPERMQYTVVGDAVSVASRLQAAAREAGVAVLASSAVVEVAGPMEGVEKPASHGVILVPGRPEGVNAFVVVSGSP